LHNECCDRPRLQRAWVGPARLGRCLYCSRCNTLRLDMTRVEEELWFWLYGRWFWNGEAHVSGLGKFEVDI
jgi:hypothetical protein